MRTVLTILMVIFLFNADLTAETFTKKLGGYTYLLEEVFYDDFSGDLTNWSIEGDAKVGISQGWLEVDCGDIQGVAATIWCKREFEGSQLVEYDVRLMSDSRQSNINMFLMASIQDGPGILETSSQRSGKYSEYHLFPNYLITILNGTSPAKREMLRLRMRLNPGFQLVEEKWLEPLEFGRIYHVSYLIQSSQVSVYLNEIKAAECKYEQSLNQGLLGLRIWSTHSIYDNFRVSRIVR